MKREWKTTTAEALLGLLSAKPMSGYELKRFIDSSIGDFWTESFGQIYPILKRLEQEGLLRGREGERSGSTVYSLTDAGRDRLRAWLGVAPTPQVMRNELLLKLFFGNLGPVAGSRRHVEEFRKRTESDRRRYAEIERSIKGGFAGHPALPYWLISLNYGRIEAEALLHWAEETLAMLDGLAAKAYPTEELA